MEIKKQIVLKIKVPEHVLKIYLKTYTFEEIKKLIAENGIPAFIENSKTLGFKPQEFDSTW